jgi:dTDP-4-amino-4,6-dideoxygalactose transaminase
VSLSGAHSSVWRGGSASATPRAGAPVDDRPPHLPIAADRVPFNRPYYVGDEHRRVLDAIAAGHISASGAFTARCERALEDRLTAARVLLTPSGTAALEATALLLGIGPGDEVIMPSFTFSSTANAFVLRGGVPVFVDIRPDTQNLDERLVEAAITSRTRAIVAVHYAGVGCDMAILGEIADRHGLALVEDAAHAAMASHEGRPLGTFGLLGALSFHETKNLTCGEGGALIVNDAALVAQAEILRDKGTNRSAFLRGDIDRYTWVDIGSSFGLSDLNAAFLWAQLCDADAITAARLRIWNRYDRAFAGLETRGLVRRPTVPAECEHNAHMYYLLLPGSAERDALIAGLRRRGVDAVFHYVPLHSSPAGRRLARCSGRLTETERQSARIVRLPLWAAMTDEICDRVIAAVAEAIEEFGRPAAGDQSADRCPVDALLELTG